MYYTYISSVCTKNRPLSPSSPHVGLGDKLRPFIHLRPPSSLLPRVQDSAKIHFANLYNSISQNPPSCPPPKHASPTSPPQWLHRPLSEWPSWTITSPSRSPTSQSSNPPASHSLQRNPPQRRRVERIPHYAPPPLRRHIHNARAHPPPARYPQRPPESKAPPNHRNPQRVD